MERQFSATMSEAQLAEWLRGKDIDGETCGLFESKHKVKGKIFPTLKYKNLLDMGVPMGPLMEILALIDEINNAKPHCNGVSKEACGLPYPTTNLATNGQVGKDHHNAAASYTNGAGDTNKLTSQKQQPVEITSKGTEALQSLGACQETLAGCHACWRIPDPMEQSLPLPSHPEGAMAACTPSDSCFWNEDSLNVYINPNEIPAGWQYNFSSINGDTIAVVAGDWEHINCVPKLNFLYDPAAKKRCQIRVKFSENEGSHSLIGTNARYIRESDPTMVLNLKYGDDLYKRHLILHEFGHALGLGHEHQSCSFFRDALKFIDQDKMRECLQTRGVNMDDWVARAGQNTEASEYDPDSIMHYWMDNSWLKEEFKQSALEQLSDKDQRILLGLRRRHHSLPDRLSDKDKEWIEEKYKAALGRRHSVQDVPGSQTVHSGAATQPEAEGSNLKHEALLEKFRARNFRAPKQDVLLELVGAKIPSHWERFGLGVGIEPEDLYAIKGDHGGRSDFDKRCFGTVFAVWENTESSPYTWVKVAEVMLMKIGKMEKATNKLYDTLEEKGY